MTIREAFANFLLNKSTFKKSNWSDLTDICGCFEIYNYVEQDEDNPRFTVYFLHTWYCTDSWVGYRVWLLDDEPIAITYQSGRKYDQDFYWLSDQAFNKTHKVILDLHGVKKLDYTPMTPDGWNIEMKNFN